MEALNLLKNYKKRVDVELKKYFDRKIKEAQKAHSLSKEVVKLIANFTLASGKRIRPAFIYYSYLANGGKKEQNILEASMSIELTHTFLLIHDDIIDKDEMRHGVSTLHESYKKIGKKIAPQKDTVHFGNSMAMMAGDISAAMANEILFNSRFDAPVIIKALDRLQQIVYNIVPGEMLDVMMEMRGKSTEEEVLKMYEGKTASYSFEGPLHLGTVLAGNDNPEILNLYSQYAIPLGIAFQIRDDILGIFGNEQKIGKPVASDVIEGKQTVLVIKALELGNKKQQNTLKKYLGKKDLAKKELGEFRSVISDSGALGYCQAMSERLIKDSLSALSMINIKNQEAQSFFRGIAEYMVKREY